MPGVRLVFKADPCSISKGDRGWDDGYADTAHLLITNAIGMIGITYGQDQAYLQLITGIEGVGHRDHSTVTSGHFFISHKPLCGCVTTHAVRNTNFKFSTSTNLV
jgi:hypothetical protein